DHRICREIGFRRARVGLAEREAEEEPYEDARERVVVDHGELPAHPRAAYCQGAPREELKKLTQPLDGQGRPTRERVFAGAVCGSRHTPRTRPSLFPVHKGRVSADTRPAGAATLRRGGP